MSPCLEVLQNPFGAHSGVLWYKTLRKFLQVFINKLEMLGGGRLAFGFLPATTLTPVRT